MDDAKHAVVIGLGLVALVVELEGLGANGGGIRQALGHPVVSVVAAEIVEVGKDAGIGTVEGVHGLEEPVGVLGISTVGFDHDFYFAVLGVVAEAPHPVLRVLHVLVGVSSRAAVHPDGVAPELGGAIDPAFVLVDGPVALGLVLGIELVLGVDQDKYVLHAFPGGALDQLADVFLVGMLAPEGTVPVLDVGNPELVLAKGRVVEVVELAPDPAVKGVFLNADLKAVGVVLGDGVQRGGEGKRGATEGDVADEGASG